MDGTLQLANEVLFWAGSSFVRSKAVEVLLFIQQMDPSKAENIEETLQKFRRGCKDKEHKQKFDTLLKRVSKKIELDFNLRSSQRRRMNQQLHENNVILEQIDRQEKAKPTTIGLFEFDDIDNTPEDKLATLERVRYKPPPIHLQCEHIAPAKIEFASWVAGGIFCNLCGKDVDLDIVIAAKFGDEKALQL